VSGVVNERAKQEDSRMGSHTRRSEFCISISAPPPDSHKDCSVCAMDPCSSVMPLFQGNARMTVGSGLSDKEGSAFAEGVAVERADLSCNRKDDRCGWNTGGAGWGS
jgi:hypothetical protein